MKLIDLLVKELPRRGGWPEGAEIAVQDTDSQICFSSHSDVYANKEKTDWYDGDLGNGCWDNPFIDTIADDRHECIVSRKQYEAALAASDGWIEWNGGDCPVDSDAIVEVRYWNQNQNQYRYNNDRAGDFEWSHTGSYGDIIAYRLQQPTKSEQVRADAWRSYAGMTENDDESDLNECIGQDVGIPEWNGEGLPPVGLICEGRFHRHPGISFEWQECLVLYVFERECAVKSKSTSTLHYCDEFRPLRTEEEKLRDEAGLALYHAINWNAEGEMVSPSRMEDYKKAYDAIAAGKIPGVKLEGK